ncbi:hypothetical protein BX667DRAFT_311810 [Coemansia mojavensis]|nr:hypothetical protein BX667DRAFT_311810 [Coemansia mojavensis]
MSDTSFKMILSPEFNIFYIHANSSFYYMFVISSSYHFCYIILRLPYCQLSSDVFCLLVLFLWANIISHLCCTGLLVILLITPGPLTLSKSNHEANYLFVKPELPEL